MGPTRVRIKSTWKNCQYYMGYMTQFERMALNTAAELTQMVSALLVKDAAKSELLSLHLPNLTPEEREALNADSKGGMAVAQMIKENAKTLRLILEQNK